MASLLIYSRIKTAYQKPVNRTTLLEAVLAADAMFCFQEPREGT